ncbi:MAG: hypothetical protein SRB2_02693 [Desulfobacteraceae bacterium Eth-SRB2]|nr:MAG: hypothetical protein SRB2_02693 [Desulfobacteraceae bacterium Eth-SRB2]
MAFRGNRNRNRGKDQYGSIQKSLYGRGNKINQVMTSQVESSWKKSFVRSETTDR